VHLLASLESSLWGTRTRRERSGAPADDGPDVEPPKDIQSTITRALYASLVLGVVAGVLLLAVGATVIGVILLAIGILAAVGIYRQHRFAHLSDQ
jgi:hypothetical protein